MYSMENLAKDEVTNVHNFWKTKKYKNQYNIKEITEIYKFINSCGIKNRQRKNKINNFTSSCEFIIFWAF